MPILKREEIEFEEKDGKLRAFKQGIVDECGLKQNKQGDYIGYQLRFKLPDGKHVYWMAWFNDESKFNEFDAPKLEEVFGYREGMENLLARDCASYFMGKPSGLLLTPHKTKDDDYKVGIFKSKSQVQAGSPEALEQFKRKHFQRDEAEAQYVAPVAATKEEDDLPW